MRQEVRLGRRLGLQAHSRSLLRRLPLREECALSREVQIPKPMTTLPTRVPQRPRGEVGETLGPPSLPFAYASYLGKSPPRRRGRDIKTCSFALHSAPAPAYMDYWRDSGSTARHLARLSGEVK